MSDVDRAEFVRLGLLPDPDPWGEVAVDLQVNPGTRGEEYLRNLDRSTQESLMRELSFVDCMMRTAQRQRDEAARRLSSAMTMLVLLNDRYEFEPLHAEMLEHVLGGER